LFSKNKLMYHVIKTFIYDFDRIEDFEGKMVQYH